MMFAPIYISEDRKELIKLFMSESEKKMQRVFAEELVS